MESASTQERQKMVKQESTYYPPLYYFSGSLIYRVFYETGLLSRVFLVRITQLIFIIFTVYLSYLISKIVFPKEEIIQLMIPTLVSFHPMFTFVSSGINSDNIMNFLFTLVTYLILRLFNSRYNIRLFISLGIIIGLGFLSRPNFILVAGIATLFVLIKLILVKDFKRSIKSLFIYIFATIISGGWWLIIPLFTSSHFSLDIGRVNYTYTPPTFAQHFSDTMKKIIAETIPWYWGVFKWLGVVLPRIVGKILMRFLVLAGLGMVLYLIQKIKSKKIDKELINLSILGILFFTYSGGIIFFDYIYKLTRGYSLGIQGRYFFPPITAEMIILTVGLTAFFPKKLVKARNLFIKTLGSGMIVLNGIALHTVISSYYDLLPFSKFITQASQYKPWFLKGNFLSLIFLFYFSFLLLFIYRMVKFKKTV
ncbi:MAG: hypothetical protein UT63_C0003G0010 [Candidatus Gottesmanbacteria bacterium GW2011_GWC2_39_8]|uniref:Glycosyltransferase RgtA/B/C/D-like domain-containing protein n=1 Tax=Candidatus Gottesmanbacteria bacterium GW2011_GWC2_39_8 TaxID=1618450 RepID=A0A0G0Q1P8_9BACT|nr:MAG: hypothetical protein UT63_C0003G0010 [Candidatus Gottesmanbacteria bacterium GW2011_GWC2_39_8]